MLTCGLCDEDVTLAYGMHCYSCMRSADLCMCSTYQSATPEDTSSCLQNAVHLAVAAAEEALKAAEAASTAKAEHDSASAEQGGVEAMEVDEGSSAGGQVLRIKQVSELMACTATAALPASPAQPQPQLSVCKYQTVWC